MEAYLPFFLKKLVNYAIFFTCLMTAGCIDLAGTQSLAKNKNYIFRNKAQVFVMRGGLGGIFSTGMNQLQHTLETQYRIRTESTVWYKAYSLSQYIIKHYGTSVLPGPIILVGHSLGANEQIKVAWALNKKQIPVALLITVDAVSPQKVPANVKHVINIYKPSFVPLFSGLKVMAVNPKATQLDNVNVNSIKKISVNHFTIEKNQVIQDIMLKEILSVTR